MTAREENTKSANLEFAKLNLLDPASDLVRVFRPSMARRFPVPFSINLIETLFLLKLGVDVDFLDSESTRQALVDAEPAIDFARRIAVESEVGFSPQWINALAPEPFDVHEWIGRMLKPQIIESGTSEDAERLKQDYLGYLLVYSEVAFDHATMVFLHEIRWATNGDWQRSMGYTLSESPLREMLYIGLANHWNWIEQFHTFAYRNWQISAAQADFFDRARDIAQPRMHIFWNNETAQQRLFELGAGLAASAETMERLEWRKTRKTLFHQLREMSNLRGDDAIEKFWAVYSADRGNDGKANPKERLRSESAASDE